jgi:ketosteroid isomerase-like protein
VHVFGDVAVAAAGCEMAENGTKANRDVEMMLLVKDVGGWKIVAQASDITDMSTNVQNRR